MPEPDCPLMAMMQIWGEVIVRYGWVCSSVYLFFSNTTKSNLLRRSGAHFVRDVGLEPRVARVEERKRDQQRGERQLAREDRPVNGERVRVVGPGQRLDPERLGQERQPRQRNDEVYD